MTDLAAKFDSDKLIIQTAAIASSRFSTFAALGREDPMPSDAVDAMQVALCRWQVDKYGPQPDERMALGIIEEMTETFLADGTEDAIDGLGDVCVYSSQLATNNRLAIAPLIDLARVLGHRNGVRTIAASGLLSQVVLKGSQKIRGLDDQAKYRMRLAGAIGLCIARAIESVEEMWPEILPIKADRVFCIIGDEVLRRAAGHPSIPKRDTTPPLTREQQAAALAERKDAATEALKSAVEGADDATVTATE
jgi:hypothetical protein